MARILIVGLNYAPEPIGIGKFTAEMAEWLAQRGHDVQVIAAPPYYPGWRVENGYCARWYRHERLGSVNVWRCPLWVPAQPSAFKRVLHLFSFALSSLPMTLAKIGWRPGVVLVLQPPLLCAPASWLVARLTGACAWMHVQDLEVEAAFGLNLLRSTRLRSVVRALDGFVTRRFNRVSTITEPMRVRLLDKGVASHKTRVFPNWVDTKLIQPLGRPSRYRDELGLSGEHVVALYSGSMGVKQGLEIIVAAAQRLVALPELVFVLAGEGVAYEGLRRTAGEQKNVKWLPLQPAEQLNELLNLADFHLLPQRSGAADVMMPSKLLGMFASGRPVIATAKTGTELGSLVGGRGLVTKPGDVDAFCQACRLMTENHEARIDWGEAAREYALEHFEKDSILRSFEAELLKSAQEEN